MSGLGPMGREILEADDRDLSRSVARALLRAEYEELRRPERIGREILEARARAHAKHGDNSIEGLRADSPAWLAVLVEEVGEIAHALTYDSAPDEATRRRNLEGELVDVLAVSSAWLDASRADRGDGS